MNKNLNDIIPPSRRRALENAEGIPTPAYQPQEQMQAPRPEYQRPIRPAAPRRKFPVGTAVVALAVIAASVGALFAFSGAKVEVTPAMTRSNVQGEFIATVSGGDLPFEVITVEKVATASAPSEGTENVNQSAQGSITIMNKQDAPQQLIKNTRFQNPAGLVFRIRDSVTVPAASNGTPGSVTVTVYADAAGENYNIGPSTFTLPGLSGGPAFELVTAMSSEAMKGGFAGPRPTVGQATRDAKYAELQQALTTDIQSALATAVPEGHLLMKGADRVAYEPQPDEGSAGNNVTLAVKATATAVVFPKDALAKAIAFQVAGSYAGQPVTIETADGLMLTPVGDIPAPGAQEFAFSLSGSTVIVWQVDAEKIAGAVSGKSREQAQIVLGSFPEVDAAKLVLRPFWAQKFPQDPAKISVTVAGTPAE